MNIDFTKTIDRQRLVFKEHWGWSFAMNLLTAIFVLIFGFIGLLTILATFQSNSLGPKIFLLSATLFNLSFSVLLLLGLIKRYKLKSVKTDKINLEDFWEKYLTDKKLELEKIDENLLIYSKPVSWFRWNLTVILLLKNQRTYVKVYSESTFGTPNPASYFSEN